jgi:hypothetical protein
MTIETTPLRKIGPTAVLTVVRTINLTRLDEIRNALTALLRWTNDPTVRNLSTVLENNEWHKGSVLTHTLAVADAFRRLLELGFVTDAVVAGRLSRHLDVVVDPASANKLTRTELTCFASFLHDIGKGMKNPKTGEDIVKPKIKDGKKVTEAPGHAEVGSQKAYEIALNLGCSQKEAEYVRDIVRNHMLGFNLESSIRDLDKKIQDAKFDGRRASFEKARAGLVPDFLKSIGYDPLIILHTMADLMGSEGNTQPTESSFFSNLILSLFRLPRCTKIEQLESLAKAGSVILVPGSASIGAEVKRSISDEIEGRIQRGEMPEKQAEKARQGIEGRVAKVLAAIKYVTESTSADQAEESFYSNPGSKLGQVIIFDRIVDVPRPPLLTNPD